MTSNQNAALDPINFPWPTNSNNQDHDDGVVYINQLPTLTKREYGNAITHFRLTANKPRPTGTDDDQKILGLHYLLYHLRKCAGGVCNIIVANRMATALIGSDSTLEDQRDLLGRVMSRAQDSGTDYVVVSTGGFYSHYPKYHRLDYNEWDGSDLYQLPVGQTSLGEKYIPIPRSLKDLYEKVSLTHGYLHLPKLDGNFPNAEVDPANINTLKGRMEYRAKHVDTGNFIPNPNRQEQRQFDAMLTEVKERRERGEPVHVGIEHDLEEFAARGQYPAKQRDGSLKVAENAATDSYVRTNHSYVAGSLSHGKEPNERQLLIQFYDGTTIHLALTVGKKLTRVGWTVDDAYAIAEGALVYLGLLEWGADIATVANVYNTDGGPSVMLGVVGCSDEPGRTPKAHLLAKGGQSGDALPTWDLSTNFRKCNALIITAHDQFASQFS